MKLLGALALLYVLAPLNSPPRPFFAVEHRDGKWWFSNEGKPFWSFGVDCVDLGTEPSKVKADNPAYSGLKVYPNQTAWAKASLGQLRSWGFNTLGGWCDVDALKRGGSGRMLPYTMVLHLGAYDRAPWHDLYSNQMEMAIVGAAKAQIPDVANDPNLIGYFTDNELGWWDDTLFSSYLAMPSEAPGHKKIVEFLESFYGHSLRRLQEDWILDLRSDQSSNGPDPNTQPVYSKETTTFNQLHKMYLRPEGSGRKAIKSWAGQLAGRYYKLVHDAIRRYDTKHLILGDRYCQYFSLPVAQAAAPYLDVVSTNYGADWNDGSICHFYLDTLHRGTLKPLIITEFYMCARENRSGNKNDSDGFPVVATQKQRAAAFSRYVRSVASLPYMLGAHWFQYTDEPGKGRGDGENYDMGLVDISGRPYEAITAAAKSLKPARIHARGMTPPEVNAIPTAPAKPLEGFKAWDRVRGFISADTKLPVADLYAAWKPEGLYLGFYAMDYSDPSLYVGKKIPESERQKAVVHLPGGREVSIRYGGDRPPRIDGSGVVAKEQGGLKSSLEVLIPSACFTEGRLGKGHKLLIDAECWTTGRAEHMSWKRRVTLR